MKTRRLAISIIAIVVFSLLVVAQQANGNATVKGKLVYSDTGKPLRRAFVGLKYVGSVDDISSKKYEGNEAIDLNASDDSDYVEIDRVYSMVLTSDDGAFEFPNVKPGVYFPFVRQPGIVNPDSADVDNPSFQKIVITEKGAVDVDIAVRRGGSIEGTIRYVDGSVASGITVTLSTEEQKNTDEHTRQIKADDRGVYRFAGLKKGTYFVSTSEPMGGPRSKFIQVYFPGEYNSDAALPVSVRLGNEVSGINMTIPGHQMGTVSGTVVAKSTGEPVVGADVFVVPDDLAQAESMPFATPIKTRSDGVWSGGEIRPGRYRVFVHPVDSFRRRKKSQTNKFVAQSKIIDVAGDEKKSISFELDDAGTITGKIVFEDRAGTAKLEPLVQFYSDEYQSSAPSFSRDEGKTMEFEISDLAGGDYRVSILDQSGGFLKSVKLNGKDITDGTISVKPKQSVTGLEIVVSGKVGTLKIKHKNDLVRKGQSLILLVPVSDSTSRYTPFSDFRMDQFKDVVIRARPGRYYVLTNVPLDPWIRGLLLYKNTDARLLSEDQLRDAKVVTIEEGKTTEITID